jgi:hypothetical protein
LMAEMRVAWMAALMVERRVALTAGLRSNIKNTELCEYVTNRCVHMCMLLYHNYTYKVV